MKHYCSKGDKESKQNMFTVQNMLQTIRSNFLHPIFYKMLINTKTRNKTLAYIDQALLRNSARTKYVVNGRQVACDGFMMNVTNVLQFLAGGIHIEKVDLLYPFDPTNVLGILKDESRIKMQISDAEKFRQELINSKSFNESPSFNTICFFQTLYSHHISVLPLQRKY